MVNEAKMSGGGGCIIMNFYNILVIKENARVKPKQHRYIVQVTNHAYTKGLVHVLNRMKTKNRSVNFHDGPRST